MGEVLCLYGCWLHLSRRMHNKYWASAPRVSSVGPLLPTHVPYSSGMYIYTSSSAHNFERARSSTHEVNGHKWKTLVQQARRWRWTTAYKPFFSALLVHSSRVQLVWPGLIWTLVMMVQWWQHHRHWHLCYWLQFVAGHRWLRCRSITRASLVAQCVLANDDLCSADNSPSFVCNQFPMQSSITHYSVLLQPVCFLYSLWIGLDWVMVLVERKLMRLLLLDFFAHLKLLVML